MDTKHEITLKLKLTTYNRFTKKPCVLLGAFPSNGSIIDAQTVGNLQGECCKSYGGWNLGETVLWECNYATMQQCNYATMQQCNYATVQRADVERRPQYKTVGVGQMPLSCVYWGRNRWNEVRQNMRICDRIWEYENMRIWEYENMGQNMIRNMIQNMIQNMRQNIEAGAGGMSWDRIWNCCHFKSFQSYRRLGPTISWSTSRSFLSTVYNTSPTNFKLENQLWRVCLFVWPSFCLGLRGPLVPPLIPVAGWTRGR